MGLDNVRMDPVVSRDFSGGPAFATDIIVMDGGAEERVQNLQHGSWAWFLTKEAGRARVFDAYKFYLSRRGALHAFRFFDWLHYTTNPTDGKSAPAATDQFLGYGDGATTEFPVRVQLLATGDHEGRTSVRAEILPIHGETDNRLNAVLGRASGTPFVALVAIDGTPQASGWSLNPLTRRIKFTTAPALGETVTWGGYFDNPARFGESTDQRFEAHAHGSDSTSAVIEVVSVPYEDQVPDLMDFGGYYHDDDFSADLMWSHSLGRVVELDPQAAGLKVFLPDPFGLGTGSGHAEFVNSGANAFDVVDHLGGAVGTVSTGTRRRLLLQPSGTSKVWVLA